MKVRPIIRIGDLVKLKKRSKSKKVFRVTDFSVDLIEARKVLGVRLARTLYRSRRKLLSLTDEGFIWVHVRDEEGMQWKFKRRAIWVIPTSDQPRYGTHKRRKRRKEKLKSVNPLSRIPYSFRVDAQLR